LLDPPQINPPTISGSSVLVGACKITSGHLIALLIRIVILLYAVLLAVSVRNVHSTLNESKTIGFSVYNWAVFIGVGSALADFALTNPSVVFIATSISIFIPSVSHTLTLAGYKVYRCLVEPDAPDVRQAVVNSRSARPLSASSKVASPSAVDIKEIKNGGTVDASNNGSH